MKRAIAGLVLVVFVLFLTSSINSSLLSAKLTNKKVGIPNANIRPTANAEKIQNAENHEENMCNRITGSEEAKASRSAASGDYSQFQSETDQNANASTNPSFPDGAIYYGGEPPYAYIPTYDPREPHIIRIPNAPQEPETEPVCTSS